MTTLKERLTDVTVAAAIIFSILGIVFYSITYPILYFVITISFIPMTF